MGFMTRRNLQRRAVKAAPRVSCETKVETAVKPVVKAVEETVVELVIESDVPFAEAEVLAAVLLCITLEGTRGEAL